MKHGQDLHVLAAHAIGRDIRHGLDDQLARFSDAAGAAVGMCRQEIGLIENGGHDGGGGMVAGETIADLFKVLQRRRGASPLTQDAPLQAVA